MKTDIDSSMSRGAILSDVTILSTASCGTIEPDASATDASAFPTAESSMSPPSTIANASKNATPSDISPPNVSDDQNVSHCEKSVVSASVTATPPPSQTEEANTKTSNTILKGTPTNNVSHQSTSSGKINPSMMMINSATLYVGDLHENTDEASLFELFQPYGPIQSIRICRDYITGKSLRYAYVNYIKVEDAKIAMSERNCYKSQKTGHQALRVMWKHRDPTLRRSGEGNIFIKDLHPNIDNKTLLDTFGQLGTILSSKVAMDRCGQSLGYGFVHFESPDAAINAIKEVNGMELMGKKVYVSKFAPKSVRKPGASATKQFTNVYLKNLSAEYLTDAKLRELFSAYAPITSIHIPTTAENTPVGYAFINFHSCDMAERAVAEMNDKDIDGQTLYVTRAQKRSERTALLREQYARNASEQQVKRQGRNLYVKHLSTEVDKAALENHFSPYGTVESCIIVRDQSGASRGFGFVCFTTAADASKAMSQLNGTILGDTKTPIFVAMAQRKDERRRMIQSQSNRQINPRHTPSVPQMYPFHPIPPFYPMQWFPRQENTRHVSNFISMSQNINNFVPPPGTNPGSMQMGPQSMAHQVARMNHHVQQPMQSSYYNASRQQYAAAKNNMTVPVQIGFQSPSPGSARTYAKVVASSTPPHNQKNATDPDPIPPILTADVLADATPEQCRYWLGNKLHPLVASINNVHAGKITGMLLELDVPDIVELIDDSEALKDRVVDALKVLEKNPPAENNATQTIKNDD